LIKKKIKEFGADFLLLLVALAWGGTFVIVQDAIRDVPVYIFLFWRFGLSALILGIVFYKRVLHINKENMFAGVILGIFMFLGFAFQTFGLSLTYSSTVAFITGLNVIIVPFTLFVVFGKKASIFSVFGAVCASLGLYFLTLNDFGGFGAGEFYSLICAFMFAFHIVFTDRYSKKYDVILLVIVQFFTVAVLSFILAFFIDGSFLPSGFTAKFVNALIVTVLFATIFAFGVQTAMQRYTTPAKTAIIFTFEPVSAGIFGYCFANEKFSSIQLFGALLIVSGMLVAETGAYFRGVANAKK